MAHGCTATQEVRRRSRATPGASGSLKDGHTRRRTG
nr:MAG TPA: hypothetical protein [Caudoviricetes sp.]DAV86096.1 MAG TPA: hypothetical protein [Caudoviricetes sp.]